MKKSDIVSHNPKKTTQNMIKIFETNCLMKEVFKTEWDTIFSDPEYFFFTDQAPSLGSCSIW